MNKYKGFSLSELKEWLDYNPVTGNFTWLKSHSNMPTMLNSIAGCVNGGGYIQIRLKGKQLLAHHMAWFFQTGELVELIDHEDRNTQNNAWVNLRLATVSQNNCNRKFKGNNSGHQNIHLMKSNNPGGQYYYCCSVMKDGVSHRKTFPHTEEGLNLAILYVQTVKNLKHGEFKYE